MDYYKLLGVDKDATLKEIKETYQSLIKNSKKEDETIKKIKEAYNTLSDKEKRAKYDKKAKTEHIEKKNKGKNKAFIFVVIFLAIIFLAALVSNMTSNESKLKNISVSDYLKLFNGSEISYIYIGKTSCTYCQQINPILNKIIGETDITINYINLESISTDDYNTLVNSNDVLKGDWGTPTLLIVQNGKVIDSHIGYAEYATIKQFLLQEDEDTSKFNSIDLTKYLALLNGSDKSYIYIGKTSCTYCQQTNPLLAQIVDETGITINYLNIENFSEEEYTTLTNSNDVLKGDWGTPTILIVQNGKVIDGNVGYTDYDNLKSFLLQE